MPTNQEFTTVAKDDQKRYNETLFNLMLVDGDDNQRWKTKAGYFRLVHAITKVSLWTHSKALPDWAFKQQEINGNKNPVEKTAVWYAEDIIEPAGEPFYLSVDPILNVNVRRKRVISGATEQGAQVTQLLQEICRATASDVAAQCWSHFFPSICLIPHQLAIPHQRYKLLD
jgi:hypothetical protein